MTDPAHENATTVAAPQASTLPQRLCNSILKCVREIDNEASISTVSKWDHDDSTLIRIKSSIAGAAQPIALLRALKTSYPLARVTTVENFMDGSTEAQILMPSRKEQYSIAQEIAADSKWNVWLRRACHGLLFAFVVTFAMRVAVDASR